MAQADGTIIIDTEINADGIKAGSKEIEASVRNMANSVENLGAKAKTALSEGFESASDSAKGLEKELKKVESQVDEMSKKEMDIKIHYWYENEESIEDLPFDEEPIGEIGNYESFDGRNIIEEIEGVENKVNEFRHEIERTKQYLKSLEADGQWFGDEDYDDAYADLLAYNKALKEHQNLLKSDTETNPFGLDTLAGKIREAELELNKLVQAGKGLGDAEYDEAYRNLALLSKEAREYRKELEKSTEIVPAPNLDTYEGKIQQLENQLRTLKDAGKGLGDAEYDAVYRKLQLMKEEAKNYAKELSKSPEQLQKEQAKIDALNQKLLETQRREAAAAAEASKLKAIGDAAEISNQDVVDLNNGLIRLKARQAELEKAGLGLGYKEYDENISSIAQLESRLRSYSSSLKSVKKDEDTLSASSNNLSKVTKSLGKTLSSVLSRLKSISKKGFSAIATTAGKATKAMNGFGKSAKSTNMSLGRMLASSVLFSTVFGAISTVTSGIKEGVENLAQYSSSFNSNISSMISALTRLKNSFATAFAPILSVVGPIITKFINMLATAITYIGMFIAALTGQSTFTKAKEVQEDYAASLGDTASAAEDAADATDDAADAAERYLSPLDDINKFTEQSSSSSNSGSGSSGSGSDGGVSIDDMFETVTIPNSIKNLAEEAKELFGGIFETLKTAWDNEGEPTLTAAQNALNSLLEAAKSVGSTFYEVFTSQTGVTWCESILRLLQSIFNVITSIATAFATAWNSGAGIENVTALFNMFTNINTLLTSIGNSFATVFSNGIGVSIWTNILNIITGVYNIIGNLAGQINAAWNTAGIGDSIWQGILTTVDTVLSFINRIVTATADWAGNLNFVPLLSSISNLLNSISPVVEAIGNFLGDIYENIILPVATALIENVLPTIINLLASLFTFLGENEWIIEAVGVALLAAFAASVIVPLITTIISAMSGFISTVSAIIGILTGSSGFSAAISAIVTALGGPLTVAIMAIIAIGILLITHWDDIKNAAATLASWIVEKWDKITEFVGNVKDKIVDAFDSAIEWLKEAGISIITGLLEGIIDGIKSIGTWIKENIFQPFIDGFKSVFGINSPSTVMAEMGKYLMEGLSNGISSLIDTVVSIFGTIHDKISETWEDVKTSASTKWEEIKTTVSTKWENIKSTAGTKFDEIKSNISTTWDNVKTTASTKWEEIKSTVSTKWENIKSTAETKFDEVKSNIDTAWNNTKTAAGTKWEEIKTTLSTKWEDVKSTASTKFTDVKNTIDTKWNDIKSSSSTKWSNIKSTLSTTWTEIKNAASTKFGDIKDKISTIWENIKTKTKNLWSGNNGIVSVIKGAINSIIGGINGMISGIVSGINSVIRALNSISFTIPSWVPGFGGKNFGFSISTISASQIPYLASGAVIPPNKEFLAVLGDQTQGNNIEAPESLLRRIVREEAGTSGNTYEVSAKVGRKELFKIIVDEAKAQRAQTGRNPFELA